jgi:hypothetical protein
VSELYRCCTKLISVKAAMCPDISPVRPLLVVVVVAATVADVSVCRTCCESLVSACLLALATSGCSATRPVTPPTMLSPCSRIVYVVAQGRRVISE